MSTKATELLQQQPISDLLDGHRGAPRVDRTALAACLVAVSKLIAGNPSIAELDLNPVIASSSRVIASSSRIVPVDVRIIVSDQQQQEP
ncbi:MAG: acetate--CoA ligase family protein [Solirubrobacterales bacterium]|nr:acetate--CoA ligase family protein [Solirubrobacterales bacterium]